MIKALNWDYIFLKQGNVLKSIFTTSFTIFQIFSLLGQYNRSDYNWILGSDEHNAVNKIHIVFDDLGLNRITGIEADEKNRIPAEYSASSISDIDGNLALFSTGCYIANASYDTLINSFTLALKRRAGYCKSRLGWPIDQSNMILPWPDKEGKYKLLYTNWGNPFIQFEEDSTLYPSFSEALFSCDVQTNNQNEVYINSCWDTILYDTVCEAYIMACYNDNLKDWWIISPRAGSNCYFIFTFNKDGIRLLDRQCIGPMVGRKDFIGQAKFSPNRKKYARFNGTQLILMDFNSATGSLSNAIELRNTFNDTLNQWGGISFSPNSRFLYVFNTTKVYQYDILEQDIKASEVLIRDSYIDTLAGIYMNYNHGLLGPDGKIYLSGIWWSNQLSVIESPNCKGTLCNLIPGAITLPGNNVFSLPNFPTYKIWDENSNCVVNSQNEEDTNGNFYLFNNNNNLLLRNYKFSLSDNAIVKILNIDGKIIQEFNKPPESIDLKSIKLGIYFLIIYEKGYLSYKKLCIL